MWIKNIPTRPLMKSSRITSVSFAMTSLLASTIYYNIKWNKVCCRDKINLLGDTDEKSFTVYFRKFLQTLVKDSLLKCLQSLISRSNHVRGRHQTFCHSIWYYLAFPVLSPRLLHCQPTSPKTLHLRTSPNLWLRFPTLDSGTSSATWWANWLEPWSVKSPQLRL